VAKKSVSAMIEEDLSQLRQDEYKDALSQARARKQAKEQSAEARIIVDEISDVLSAHKIDPNTKSGFRRFVQLVSKRVMSASSGGGYARTLSGEEDEVDFSKQRDW